MATITWTGNAGDNLWLNPANWSSGDTPSSLDTVVINTQSLGANGPRGWGPTIGGLVLGPNTTLSVYGGPATASLDIGTVGTGAISGGVIYAFNGKITAGTGVTSASGVVVLDQNASYRWDGINSTQTIRMHYHPYLGVPVSPNVTFAFSTQFDGTIENFYATNIITYAGTGTVTGMTLNGHTVTYTTTAGSYTLTFGNDVNVADLIFNSGTGSITTLQVDPNVPCFTPGTLIRTERGDIAVETLDVGDMVVTASGEHRPIIWLGHHTMKRDGSAEFQSACPVRIQAGAFGDQMPYADLWLSPGHAVCVRILDEVLIPAGYLINGATIAQVDVDEVTYWHVELGSHDILLANGLPTESYLDCGSRAWFEGSHGVTDPDRKLGSPADYCRPLILDGLIVEAVASRLRARAELLGWTKTTDMDIHIVADGVRIEPDIDEGLARFLIPVRARDVRLVSETFIPAEWSDSGDERRLGISINRLHINDGLRCSKDIDLNDPRLDDGFHYPESENGKSWRWTNGSLKLPSELWADCRTHVFLRVTMDSGGSPHWVAGSKTRPPRTESADTNQTNIVPLRAA